MRTTEVVTELETPAPVSAQAEGRRSQTEVRIRGQAVLAPSTEIQGRVVVRTGGWLRMAAVQDEDLIEGPTLPDAGAFIASLKKSRLNADVLTFAQRIPDTEPRYSFRTEWENAAALPITTFDHWWNQEVEYSIRKAVNKAKKCGVVAKVAEFTDEFVETIRKMYAETPARQGRAFWHYGKDFQTVRRELGTYLDRSTFLGVYHEEELIGSMKVTYVDSTATIMQIFCSHRHFDKRPNNALIARAVELCATNGVGYLIYGNFTYNDLDTSLTEFKRRNGFKQIDLPRYYVPLTLKGQVALQLGMQRGMVGCIPPRMLKEMRRIRAAWYARKSGGSISKSE